MKYLPAILVGKLLFFSTIHAGVIQFFDPTKIYQNQTFQVDLKTFIANDPVSMKEFFDDWKGEYTPKDTQNIALLDSRFAVGVSLKKNYYLEYFYQYSVFLDTNKEFTDFLHSVKNKNNLIANKIYTPKLDIIGIKQNGLLVSKSQKIFENDKYTFGLAGAFYISYGTEMQDGVVNGDIISTGAKDYDIDVSSSYYYTHNYLYDLDVKGAYGYGYGSHVGLYYENKEYLLKIKFLANDLVSKMYWKNLPYSKILLKTKNKSYNENGYVKYDPSISGLEQYRNYTQRLVPSYKFESNLKLKNIALIGGIEHKYKINFPYLKMTYEFNQAQTFDIMYESRFGSFGFGYEYKWFKVEIIANKFTNFSSFGFNTNLKYKF